jgi:hypothetical protein
MFEQSLYQRCKWKISAHLIAARASRALQVINAFLRFRISVFLQLLADFLHNLFTIHVKILSHAADNILE